MEQDQEFALMVVKALVENPDKVVVDRKVDEMGVLLTLTVDPADMGKIIGKEGRTAKAIRTLLRVIGARSNARVNLKINEPEGSTFVRPGASDDAAIGDDTAVTDDTATAASTDDQPTVDAAPATPDAPAAETPQTAEPTPAEPAPEEKDENPTSIL